MGTDGPMCIADNRCVATSTTCPDFSLCINKNGWLSEDSGDGTTTITVSCADPDAMPANNGGSNGVINCVCDGNNDCEWQSTDFLGEITEDGICPSDSNCPISTWLMYDGELQLTREKFLSDPLFNTLQDDLYDNNQAEVLGRIQTSAIANFANNDWTEGHFLVVVWQADMLKTVAVTPYGDYYDKIETDFGDGDVQVWETFTDNLVLRDGSTRDLTQNMDIVLDIRHNYDLDLDDISELLNFRIAMIPKVWLDNYGDEIRRNGQQIAECLNQVLNNNAKFDGQLKRSHSSFKKASVKPTSQKKPKSPKNKWKNKGKKSNKSWKQRQAAKKARQAFDIIP